MTDKAAFKITEAAEYCGLSVKGYRAAMRRGYLPRSVSGMKIYSKQQIDRYLDMAANVVNKPDAEPGYPSVYDQWKATQNEDKFNRNKCGAQTPR